MKFIIHIPSWLFGSKLHEMFVVKYIPTSSEKGVYLWLHYPLMFSRTIWLSLSLA
jgi:hypothetical protein